MQDDVPDPTISLFVRRRGIAPDVELFGIGKPEGAAIPLFLSLRISSPTGKEVRERCIQIDQCLLEAVMRRLTQKRGRLLQRRQFRTLGIVINRAARPGKSTALLQTEVFDQPHAPARFAAQNSLRRIGI